MLAQNTALNSRTANPDTTQVNESAMQAEPHLRSLKAVLIDMESLSIMVARLERQIEGGSVIVHSIGEGLKSIDELSKKMEKLIAGASELEQAKQTILQLAQKVAERDRDIVTLHREIARLTPEEPEIVHPSVYRIFNVTRESINTQVNRVLWPSVRAWSTFVDWSASPNAKLEEFTHEFKKVDLALLGLRTDESILDRIRKAIAFEVSTTVSRNLLSRITVSWDFIDQILDKTKCYSEGGGQKIKFVSTAFICRDGTTLERAAVECT